MAALPSPTQVAGANSAIYEAYYSVVDPKGFGSVGGMEAARFLKKSGLSDVMLSRIWDLSDPGGRGSLDKAGMFVALKLVALVQNGKDLSLNNISLEVPPPKMGDIPLPKKPVKPPPPTTPLITSLPPSAVDWTVKPSEREKYDKLFDSLQPLNGLIPGNKVKNVLMESKLPFDTLGKIWDLADQDKDGMLDRHEFIVAMHLVYKALEKHAIPNTLPIELMPPSKRKGSTPLGAPLLNQGLDGVKPVVPPPPIQTQPPLISQPLIPVQPVKPIQPAPVTPSWVVTADEKAKSDTLFIKSDIDKDGFVSGQEIKDVFLQSGVPQPVLAHIWYKVMFNFNKLKNCFRALCDIKQCGKLNNEQFALAMWLVARCLKGIEPPAALTPEMIPPSFRSSKPAEVDNNNTRYSNPELDMISKDLEELSREKLALETDIAQKEADIKIKTGEIKSLQSELDTLAATLKQLENQKGEAQKRLNDLKAQRVELEGEKEKVDAELELHLEKVEKLRAQAAEQAELVNAQEAELNSKKQQLEGLRMEEQKLEQQKLEGSKKLESLTSNLQETQLSISQAKALITQLQEQSRQMNDAISLCDSAIESNDTTLVPDTALRINPDFRDQQISKVISNKQNGFSDDDPFKQNGSGFEEDPFKNDPFSKDGFGNDFNAFSKSNAFGDPFAAKNDPFGDFGAKEDVSDGKDPFGCDPFAVLHAPTRDGSVPNRPSSPSPALPPKKSKQPPPRPAPPRPAMPPAKKEFGFNSGFADFSDFDSKLSNSAPGGQAAKGLDFTDDPFRDYRYEDPFNITFDDEDKDDGFGDDFAKAKKFDPFNLEGRQSVPLPSQDPFKDSGRISAPTVFTSEEDRQLAWAAQESVKVEEERRRRMLQKQLQEQADLELAISLSKESK